MKALIASQRSAGKPEVVEGVGVVEEGPGRQSGDGDAGQGDERDLADMLRLSLQLSDDNDEDRESWRRWAE